VTVAGDGIDRFDEHLGAAPTKEKH
jgi:hypothetical protein